MGDRGRCGCALGCAVGMVVLGSASTRAERIDFVAPNTVVAGESFSVLARLSANEIPLYGYSLNIDITGGPGAMGRVAGNPLTSDFYPRQNVISQGGGVIDPVLSIILDPGDDGLFINAVNDEPLPVNLAVPGVNDIFARLVFDVSRDAKGLYTIDVGLGSILVHVPDPPDPPVLVEFDIIPKTIQVIPIPEPGTLGLLGALVFLARGRRVPSSSRRGGKEDKGAWWEPSVR